MEKRIEDYELGNLIMGNSRGPFRFPDRELVHCKEWQTLGKILQVQDCHWIMPDKKYRTNGLEAIAHGGYQCLDTNGQILFETFPYWWNGCTCGAEDKNQEVEKKAIRSFLSEQEEDSYYEYFMEDELNENQEKEYERLKEKMKQAEEEIQKKQVPHDDTCLVLKHNFVFMPDTDEEFWIDWYKYPFRDAAMSKDISVNG